MARGQESEKKKTENDYLKLSLKEKNEEIRRKSDRDYHDLTLI